MTNLEIIYKWGCDGSSGQAQYNQNFGESSSSSTIDGDLFMLCYVMLFIYVFAHASSIAMLS